MVYFGGLQLVRWKLRNSGDGLLSETSGQKSVCRSDFGLPDVRSDNNFRPVDKHWRWCNLVWFNYGMQSNTDVEFLLQWWCLAHIGINFQWM